MASAGDSTRALLLLPALSLPLSRPSLRTAYKGTFETVLTKLKPSLTKTQIFRLDVGVALSQSYPSTLSTSRTAFFKDLQALLQEVYILVCISALSSSVDLDLPGGLDVRIVLIEPDQSSIPPNAAGQQHLSGPLIDLKTFISRPPPTAIFSAESEAGIALDKAFTTAYQATYKASPTITRLPSGPSLTTSIPTSPLLASTTSFFNSFLPTPTDTTGPRQHYSVAVGGTFDHLHLGHKLLLTATILLASPSHKPGAHRRITIGITGDALLTSKKHASVLESWSTRQQRCQDFVESILCFYPDPSSLRTITEQDEDRPNGKVVSVTYTPPRSSSSSSSASTSASASASGERAVESPITINYTQIQDPFGPTITEEDISAIVLTAETRKGGDAVNEKRREKGWRELEVFEVGVLDASPGDDEEEEEEEEEEEDEDERKEEHEHQGRLNEGFANKISSTEIRRRVVEMHGSSNGA